MKNLESIDFKEITGLFNNLVVGEIEETLNLQREEDRKFYQENSTQNLSIGQKDI